MSRSPTPARAHFDPFEALFREHYPRLCEIVHGYVFSRDVAQDIVQDLFLALWQRRSSPDAPELTTAYLYTAARNRALKHLRHQRVVQRFEERSALTEEAPGGTDHDVRLRETAEVSTLQSRRCRIAAAKFSFSVGAST